MLRGLQAGARGETNKGIALQLGIGERTVKAHLSSIYNKLGVDSRAAAIAIAATGYHGFFYHFLDIKTGLRAGDSELSTIDTACLVAGVLSAAEYYYRDTEEGEEIRDLAQRLYRRVNRSWALNGKVREFFLVDSTFRECDLEIRQLHVIISSSRLPLRTEKWYGPHTNHIRSRNHDE